MKNGKIGYARCPRSGTARHGRDGADGRRLIEFPRRRLRIAEVAPLYESVPPQSYGGTERVVAWLTEQLIGRGHEVTLYATGDSTCPASLRAGWPYALREAGKVHLGPAYQLAMLSDVYEHADEFDVIHTHVDYWSFPFVRFVGTPSVTTLHYRLDLPELVPVYHAFQDVPLIAISHSQRRSLPDMNWFGTVYHGLPADLLPFSPGPGRYLAFLGRLSRDKRPDLAIRAARRAGIPLKIAAKIGVDDVDYYESEVKRLIEPPDVEYLGEINDREKGELLGSALAMLFPVDWPEPFGLVMIESLACGTPVIACPYGSVPEIIRDGVTGFMATDLDGLVDSIKRVDQLSRAACRLEFESRFTSNVMASRYEELFLGLRPKRRQVDSGRPARVSQRATSRLTGAHASP
jgi:glycosyltransferase involved in cell wall biosynthesis